MFYQTRNSFLNDSETASYRMECRYLHLSCIVPSAKIAIPAGVISICPDTPAAANIPNPPSARWNPPYTLAKSPISDLFRKPECYLISHAWSPWRILNAPAPSHSSWSSLKYCCFIFVCSRNCTIEHTHQEIHRTGWYRCQRLVTASGLGCPLEAS